MPTYKIIRYRRDTDNEVVVRGLTLDQAQAHCERDDTKGDGWFDGYVEEPDPQAQARLIVLNEERLYYAAENGTVEALEQELRYYVAQHALDLDVDRIDFNRLVEQVTE